MDGGRVLRALLATQMKHARATRIAASVGQIMAVLLGVLGLVGNPMLLFIAVFVFFGAQQEALYATAKENFEETRVLDIMQPLPPVFSRGTTVLAAVQMAMRDSRTSYPLVDSGLRILGLIAAEDLARALHDRASEPVDRLARDHTVTIPAQASLLEARAIMRRGLQQDYPVTNEANQLVGYLSRQDLPAGFLGAEQAGLAPVGSGR